MPHQLERLTRALGGRYLIEREIGSGGMATVYLAQDLRHHRSVAIKVLRPELTAALGPERFLREIEVTARLNHPHILPLLDSGDAGGLLYYTMPYVEGESLRDRLLREKQLPIDDALRIAGEVADALGFAHAHNVIHRDIKPENILLEAKHAVVADFGVAGAIEQAGEARLTETGIAIGTPAYLSPEQASGRRDLDGRSDVYALGCVLYEMLAGEPPFTGPTAASVVHQHVMAEPPAITIARPTVANEVAATVSRALAKAPADRHQTAEAMGEAIAATRARLVTPGAGVPPAGAAPVRAAGIRRRSLRIGAVAAVAILAAVGGALLAPRWRAGTLDPERVLVVAFADQGDSREFSALGRMVQDYIVETLTQAGFAEVVDPLTTLAVSQNVAAAGTATGIEDTRTLADEAGAGTVVSGTYYADGDSLHIQARIADARDGGLLGTVGPVGGTVGAPRELVSRVGQEVTAALASLLHFDLASWESTTPQLAAYEAYDAYIEGLTAYLLTESLDESDAAMRHFERAVAADSTFVRARLWAAQTHILNSFRFSGYGKADSLLAPLIEARGQLSRYDACRLDFVMAGWRSISAMLDAAHCMADAAPGSDDARREVALATLRSNRPRQAIRLFRQLDPDRGLMKHFSYYWVYLGDAYHMLGNYEAESEVARQGRQRFPDELYMLVVEAGASAARGSLDDVAATVEAMRSAPSHQALGPHLTLVGTELWAHGHRTAARETFDQSIAWYRSGPLDNEALRAGLAEALYRAARWDEAERLYEDLAKDFPENPYYLAGLGKLAARRGDREGALRISGRLQLFPAHRQWGIPIMQRAGIAALLGDRDGAVTLLRQTLGVNMPYDRSLHLDIDLESLHGYAPFQELTRPRG